MNLRTILVAIALIAPATPAMAESHDSYFGMSMAQGTYEIEGVIESSAKLFKFQYGSMLTDTIGLEARIGFGINSNTVADCSYVNAQLVCTSQNFNIKNLFTVYSRTFLSDNPDFRPYALLGVSRANVDVEIDGNSFNRTDSSLSYGLGIAMGKPTLGFTLEYASLFDKDDSSIMGLTAGFVARW